MKWNFTDDLPIYQQIMDVIRQGIASGELMAGERLPSVRELALEAEVNPNTMQKALAELEREGLLYSKRTSGRFVSETQEVRNALKKELADGYVSDFLEKMEKLGYGKKEIIALIQEREDGKWS
ncbi:MAG: GntR family transcriptional regulator [Lachnospiraceae bacterium]|nr:GntR family transcriptional regulator [Lachnospiraceae bacterium]